jgi:hypothetical protein
MSRALIEAVREWMGEPPRQFGFFDKLKLRVSPPAWMQANDDLREVYRAHDLLLREGRIVWSALVQANNMLFQPGPSDHPALLIHSRDLAFDDRLDLLREVAHRIYTFKNTTPSDPAERELAALVTDEMDRGMSRRLPPAVAFDRDVRSSSTMIFRKYLPRKVIESGWFPLLIHPDTPASLIVPCVYWPEELAAAWRK